MEKFFVYYSRGGCNWGDHSWGLEECASLDEAEDFVEQQKEQDPDVRWTIVQGVVRGEVSIEEVK